MLPWFRFCGTICACDFRPRIWCSPTFLSTAMCARWDAVTCWMMLHRASRADQSLICYQRSYEKAFQSPENGAMIRPTPAFVAYSTLWRLIDLRCIGLFDSLMSFTLSIIKSSRCFICVIHIQVVRSGDEEASDKYVPDYVCHCAKSMCAFFVCCFRENYMGVMCVTIWK